MLRTKFLAVGLAAAFSVVGLTACGGEQSTTEACQVAQTTVAAAEAEITEAMSGATSGDYAKVAEGFKTLSGSLKEAAGKISNEEVKGALADFQTGIDEFAGLFDGIKDGDMTALAEKAGELESASTKITEAATKLGEVCPAS